MEILNSPVAAAALILLGLFFPRLRALIPVAKPADGPKREEVSADTLPDLAEAALTVVVQVARRKFPWMSEAEAIHRFALEAVQKHEAEEAEKVAAYVKATAPAPVPDLPTA